MRRWGLVAGALAVLVVGAGAVAVLRSDDDPGLRAGSRRASGPVVEIGDEPVAYHITYRVEDRSDDERRVTTDRVWVRRPFESRLETWRGDEQLAVEIAAFGRLATGTVDQDRLVTAVPPGLPASDSRVEPVLEAAVDAGVVERRERREVLRRPCQVYRSGAFFTGGALQPPTAAEHADSCVDAAGIVLEEVLFLKGNVRHRRVAVDLDLTPRLDDELFATGEPTAEVRDGGGSVQEADPGSRPQGEYWEPPNLHLADLDFAGFEGRFSVIPPQAQNFDDPSRRDRIVAGTSDVWTHVNLIDFVVVDQGGTLGGAAPFEMSDDTPRVDLGNLGEGEVLIGSRGNEVRVLLDGGRYLRVYGPLPTDRLVEIARRLERTQGDGLNLRQ
jgi:hypothetical protein